MTLRGISSRVLPCELWGRANVAAENEKDVWTPRYEERKRGRMFWMSFFHMFYLLCCRNSQYRWRCLRDSYRPSYRPSCLSPCWFSSPTGTCVGADGTQGGLDALEGLHGIHFTQASTETAHLGKRINSTNPKEENTGETRWGIASRGDERPHGEPTWGDPRHVPRSSGTVLVAALAFPR